jgi:hypothetical protein
MYRRLYPWIFLLGGILIGVVLSGRITVRAQDRARPPAEKSDRTPLVGEAVTAGDQARPPVVDVGSPPGRESARVGQASIQDVLLRPYRFPFDRRTSLTQVCLHLKQTLGVPVVLDIAALERQDVDADDTVQLELDGVRLKTGLKLLLDQVGLTYHVIPDDNLLIITDRQGSDDPLDRIWTELKALHRDLHDVQDAVEDMADALYGEEAEGPRVRKPTIIEEKPDRDAPEPDPAEGEVKDPKAPGQKPGKAQAPGHPRGNRPTPTRVPLSTLHHSL